MKRVVLFAAISLLAACGQKSEPAKEAAMPAAPEATSPSPVEQMADIAAVKDAIGSRLEAASEVKAAIAEYFASTGEFPSACEQLDTACAEFVSISEGGVIVIDLESTGVAELAGTRIDITPQATQEGDVTYRCASNAAPRFLPPTCMNQAN